MAGHTLKAFAVVTRLAKNATPVESNNVLSIVGEWKEGVNDLQAQYDQSFTLYIRFLAACATYILCLYYKS